jgi:hypothetical protein
MSLRKNNRLRIGAGSDSLENRVMLAAPAAVQSMQSSAKSQGKGKSKKVISAGTKQKKNDSKKCNVAVECAPAEPVEDCAPETPQSPPRGKGKRKGNNGVGNGIDAQPPGNPPVNDGKGTSPGKPGNRGGAKK